MQFLCLLVLIVSVFVTNLQGVKCVHIDNVIKYLDEKIIQSQATTSEKIGLWTFQKGLYESETRINFHGTLQSQVIRSIFYIPDNNPTMTMWVTIMLLEAAGVKNSSVPTDQQLYNALEAVSTYHDKSSPDGDGMIMSAFQEKNETDNTYYCHKINIQSFLHTAEKFFNGFLNYTTSKEMANLISNMQLQLHGTVDSAYNLPPDFDATPVNIGLGSLLSTYSVTNKPFQLWKDRNYGFTHVFSVMKKYAYRPFSIGVPAVISPATYFWLREYLQSINNGYPAVFVKTWAYDINEHEFQYSKKWMPFNVNDVDLCAGAHVLYAISSLLLTNITDTEEWFDEDMQTIYENTTSLIAWMMQRNFSSRRDLAMPYALSIYYFYWFTSRTYSLLQTYNASNSLPHPALLTKVMDTLSPALRRAVTTDLLQRAKHKSNQFVYFEDFVGIDDRENGRGEDILFSTATAINILLNTWTVDGKFIPDVPSSVKEVVEKASLWLALNVNSSTFKPYNGLGPAIPQPPIYYPANIMVYKNGSVAPEGAKFSDDLIVGVHSMIPEEEYQAELKKKHFGHDTPQDFHGYNDADHSVLFLSSSSCTYASAKLALTQYKALLACCQL